MGSAKIIGGVIALAIIGGIAYLWNAGSFDAQKATMESEIQSEMKKDSSDTDAMESSDAMTKDEDDTMTKDVMTTDVLMEKVGTYEPYSAEKLARAQEGNVVLFFRASWCPTCRAVEADIQKNKNAIPAGLSILDVNYDTSTALRQQYGVTYQHTFVQVDENGEMIAKWSGSPTLSALVAEVK